LKSSKKAGVFTVSSLTRW